MDRTKSFLQIVILLMAIGIVAYNVVSGVTIQEIGIPGIAMFKFGEARGRSTVSAAEPTPVAAVSVAKPTMRPPAPTVPTATPAPAGGKPGAACTVRTTNPLVPLREEPRQFSQEISQVRPGSYAVIEHRTVNFGGLSNERWFRIEAGGRQGWIIDNTWTIAEKTDACP